MSMLPTTSYFPSESSKLSDKEIEAAQLKTAVDSSWLLANVRLMDASTHYFVLFLRSVGTSLSTL